MRLKAILRYFQLSGLRRAKIRLSPTLKFLYCITDVFCLGCPLMEIDIHLAALIFRPETFGRVYVMSNIVCRLPPMDATIIRSSA